MLTADQAWNKLLYSIYQGGKVVEPRGRKTRELIGHQTVIDMKYPIVTHPDRKLGYKFQAAEAAWILSGYDDVASIKPFSRNIENFSDDGVKFFGAYGPKISDQLEYVRNTLAGDKDSRQAYANIWREKPPKTKDVPCTLGVQFLIRDNKLHCIDTMRSSDAWLGWPYDVYNFSMLSIAVILMLQHWYPTLELGTLTLNAGSQHLYEDDCASVVQIISKTYETQPYEPIRRVQTHWGSATQFIAELWEAAYGKGSLAYAQNGWDR